MIFFIFDCPKCGSEFQPNFEETIEYYELLFESQTKPVQLLLEEPPFYPDKIVMECENLECDHKDMYTVEQLVKELIKQLAIHAWLVKKVNRPEEFYKLEDVLINHFENNPSIDENTLKNNAYLRRIFNKAHGKKS